MGFSGASKYLASQGRFGDTELAHINKDEEKLLEKYRGGRLTINPKTGLKEAFPWLLAAAAGAALTKGIGAHTRGKPPTPKSVSPEEIAGYMSPVQAQISAMGRTTNQMGRTANQMQSQFGMMQGMGQEMMDPTSFRNQQMAGQMREGSASQLAMQQLLNRRQTAGMGQSSGLLAAQNRAMGAQSQGALGQNLQGLMQNQFQGGIGVLGQSQGLLGQIGQIQGGMGQLQGGMGQMQMGIQENIAQARIAQQNQENQAALGAWKHRGSGWDIVGDILGGISSSGADLGNIGD